MDERDIEVVISAPFIDASEGASGTESKQVKGTHKNSIYLMTALSMFIILTGCAGLTPVRDTNVSIKGKEEILIARDVSNERPIWCGPGILIYTLMGKGVYRHDIETGRKDKVAEYGSTPLACTPDGEWFIYLDKGSLRRVGDDWRIPAVADLWRYEIKTGRRQRISVVTEWVSGFGESILSPDGKKLFLGERPSKEVEMPEPKWDIIWSDLTEISDAVWLPDSSAVVTSHWGCDYADCDDGDNSNNSDLVVEVLSPLPKKTVVFNLEEFGEFALIFSDRQGRIYMWLWDGEIKERIIRCSIDLDNESLSCSQVLGEDRDRIGFDMFSDGETMVFTEERNRDLCVMVMKVGGEKPACITAPLNELGYFDFGSVLDISPDDRWLVFHAYREEADYAHTDLLIVELEKY